MGKGTDGEGSESRSGIVVWISGTWVLRPLERAHRCGMAPGERGGRWWGRKTERAEVEGS